MQKSNQKMIYIELGKIIKKKIQNHPNFYLEKYHYYNLTLISYIFFENQQFIEK